MCCGDGLVRIYDFLRSDLEGHRAEFQDAPELDAPGVTAAALAGGNPLAAEAVDVTLLLSERLCL